MTEEKFFEWRNNHHYSLNRGLNILYDLATDHCVKRSDRKKYFKLLKKLLLIYEIEDEKIGIVSDTHIGSKNENIEYIKRAYDYFDKEKIRTVLHIGDLYDGLCEHQEIWSQKEQIEICNMQIEKFNKEYPKGFTNYITYGNHDEDLKKLGIDLENSRSDFIFAGFGLSFISWRGNIIKSKHRISKKERPTYDLPYDICLRGHSHFYRYYKERNLISVPTLSDNHPDKELEERNNPGFLVLTQEENISIERFACNKKTIESVLKRSLGE